MLRRIIAASVIATAFAATVPVTAQPTQPPPAAAEAGLVGLAVYSSDGQRLGEVTHAGTAGNQTIVRAELADIPGGPVAVIIPAALFVQKPDRIEMRMTAAEIKDRVTEQQQQQEQSQKQTQ